MSFLGHPCYCGYFLDFVNDKETILVCAKCDCRKEKRPEGYWVCTQRGHTEDGSLHPNKLRKLMEDILE